MSNGYLPVIKPFALQAFDPFNPPPGKWPELDPFRVVRSLLRLLDNPDAIAQSCFGLCGQVAFLRAWAYRDPEAVARFVLDLYANGRATIGGYQVTASGEHLASSWMRLPLVPDSAVFQAGQWGVGNQISESVWMVCGALAATESGSFDHATLGRNVPPIPVSTFNGQPASDLSTLTLPGELTRWLEKTGCYPGGVTDNTSVIGGKSLADDSVVTSDFDASTDVFLCVNVNMFEHATFTPARGPVTTVGFPLSWFPNHWVALKTKITQAGDTVTMNIWTWGGNYVVQVPLNDFDSNYYGSVVAHASAARRTPSASPLYFGLDKMRVYYSQDNLLHFEWQAQASVEWCELNRFVPGVGPTPVAGLLPVGADGTEMHNRTTLQRVWTADGARAFQATLPMQDPQDPHAVQYEIAACQGALRPNDGDASSYNLYWSVNCNQPAGYMYAATMSPLCETETRHFRLRYYGYPGAKQIPDPLDPYSTYSAPRADESVQFGGETIGHCVHDGSIEIEWKGVREVVGTDARTPLSIQKLAVWLEYLYRLLGRAPTSLGCVTDGKRIQVTVGDGFGARADRPPMPAIRLDLPADDQDLPGLCLKMLFALEKAGGRLLPEWVFPAFVSRVALVHATTTTAVPSGFGDFEGILKPCETTAVYRAHWKPKTGNARTLQVDVRKPMNPWRPAFVFIDFDGKEMLDSSVELTLKGQTPDGKTASIPVALQASPDRAFYYGSFQPANGWSSAYALTLSIQGTRAWASDVLRALLGDALDSVPATAATPELSPPGPLHFVNFEAGADTSHHVDVAPQSSYARVTMLTADKQEPNDSFTQPFAVPPLVVPDKGERFGGGARAQASCDGNFHDQQDEDYFDVSYECPAYDDTDAANRPASGGSSNSWGISYGHTPPQLSCRVTPEDYHCVDLAAYKYDAHAPSLFLADAKSEGITIPSPARQLGAKRGYFVLRNPNYAVLGAFSYAVRFEYVSARDTIAVDTHAPAYGGKPSVKRKILERLYERIDQPRPPEDGIITAADPGEFIEQYRAFLLEPETAALLGHSLGRSGASAVAEGLHLLGQAARAIGRDEQAVGLFRKSADVARSVGDRGRAVVSLESLAGVYESAGNRAGLRRVMKEIEELRRREAPVIG